MNNNNNNNLQPYRRGRNAGPFYKNGIDLYENDTGIRIFVNIFRFLFVIGVFIYIAIFIHNVSFFEHTYFKNPGAPGTLTSDRYNFTWIITMLSVVSHILIIMFVFFMVIFRDNFGCSITWFILYVLFFTIIVLVVVVYGLSYGSCNGSTEKDNICNSREWCCVYFPNPLNECPNIAPCVPPVSASDLKPNIEFLEIFYTNLILATLYLVFILIVLFYWFSEGPTVREEEQQQPEEFEVPPSAPNKEDIGTTIFTTVKKAAHGLITDNGERKRR